MKKYVWLLICVAIIASIIGCGRKRDLEVAKAKKEGTVLATVGDETITLEEFNDRIENMPPNIKAIALENKAEYLDNLIFETLLYKEALRRRLDEDKGVKELVSEARKRIMIARLAQDEVEDKIKIEEGDLKKYYEDHKEEFMSPELYRASHILVSTMEEAVDITDRLNAGALFEEMAKKHSLDMTGKRGGDIGYFSVGQMVPEFEDACIKLNVGEISSPVKTEFGYHIIKLTDKKKSELMSFDNIKGRVKSVLENQKRRDLFDTMLTKLRSGVPIDINKELIEPKKEEEETPLPLGEDIQK